MKSINIMFELLYKDYYPLGIILKGLINLICSVSFFFFKESAFFKTISAIFYIVFLFVSSIKILAKSYLF